MQQRDRCGFGYEAFRIRHVSLGEDRDDGRGKQDTSLEHLLKSSIGGKLACGRNEV
jgi:hypothetical protein